MFRCCVNNRVAITRLRVTGRLLLGDDFTSDISTSDLRIRTSRVYTVVNTATFVPPSRRSSWRKIDRNRAIRPDACSKNTTKPYTRYSRRKAKRYEERSLSQCWRTPWCSPRVARAEVNFYFLPLITARSIIVFPTRPAR